MKTIFIDIDGTLLNSESAASERTKSVLNKLKEQGINGYICTGRSRLSSKPVVDEVNPCRYLITATGSDIYDLQEQKVIYQKLMNHKSVTKICEIVKKYDLSSWFQNGYNSYTTKIEERNKKSELIPDDHSTFFRDHPVTQIVLLHKDLENMRRARKEILKCKGIEFVCQSETFINPNIPYRPEKHDAFLNITAKKQSKGNAVRTLCRKLKIRIRDVICVGDSANDTSMLKVAGTGVAMGNAPDNVKRYANLVIKSNDEDGLADFLEETFLKEKEHE